MLITAHLQFAGTPGLEKLGGVNAKNACLACIHFMDSQCEIPLQGILIANP